MRGAVEPGAAQGTAPAAPTLAEAGVLAELLQAAAALGCVPHAGRARELADRAYAIGAACGATELSDWADELRVRARSLDAEGLRGVLATLPGMVERLAPPAGG